MPQKVLLVEDDPNLGMLLQDYLQLKGGFDVVLAIDGEAGFEMFKKHSFDICIFDIMMPKKDGFTLAKEVRKMNGNIPIIFATAKSMMEDKAEGFGLGADDYIIKPFRIEELLMRINALLRRVSNALPKEEQATKFKIGVYEFDYHQQIICNNGSKQHISTKESELLRLLCIHANQVLTREEALIHIWNDDNYFNGRSMDVFLSKLRKYLKDDPSVEIVNVHGKGYKLLC